MIRRLRIGSLIIGLLLTACVVAGAYAALRFNIGGIRYLPPQPSTLSSLESITVSPFPVQNEKKDIGAGISGRTRAAEVARRPGRQRGTQKNAPTEKAKDGASTLPPGLSARAAASPEPDRKILKPIGYVQKANGLVEAIVSEGNGVQVVHVGDTFEEKYTVAQISREAVEVIASSAPLDVLPSASIIASNSSSGIERETEDSASASKPLPSLATSLPPKRVPDLKVKAGQDAKTRIRNAAKPELQPFAHQADIHKGALATPTFDGPKPIGYVEMSAGNRITVIPDGESVRLVKPGGTLSDRRGIDDRPSIVSRTLGFVKEADGKVQAIVDEGEGVHLVQVNDNLPGPLMAGGDSAKALEGALSSLVPPAPSPVRVASASLGKGAPPGLSPGGRQLCPPGPVQTGDPEKDSAFSGSLEPWEPPDKRPPKREAPVADDTVVPDKPPQLDVMATSKGLEAEVTGSSNRDEAVLGSLGYLNAQDWRASPHVVTSEPAAQPRGSPASDTIVLRSFGYGDWKYGRASPLAASLEVAARANGSQNTTVLKPIGYLDWQDGRTLAVVDDGDDGVRFVHEGELLDDHRFRVVKVYPKAVEIAELPIAPPGLMGNPTFQPYARQAVAAGAALPGSLEKPHGSVAAVRLGHGKDQSSRLIGGSAKVPKGSSLAVMSFALRSQGAPCFDFKSLLMMPSASPMPENSPALHLYFIPGANTPLAKQASATCAGALAF